MAPPRAPDPGIYARVARLEQRLTRIESGGVLRGPSVIVAASAFITGAYPKSVNFEVQNPNSTILVLYGGTGYVATAVKLQVQLDVDGTVLDSVYLSTAISVNVHLPLPLGHAVVQGLAAGTHVATLTETSGIADASDWSRFLILELP